MGGRKGRPPKVTSGTGEVNIEQLRKAGDPDVQFLGDLEQPDTTKLTGANPNKHYRYCLESNIQKRESQGYVVVDDPKIKSNVPGSGKVWPAEGKDAKVAGRDLVLMEMPKRRFQIRQAYKDQKIREATEAQRRQMDDDVGQAGVDENTGKVGGVVIDPSKVGGLGA